MAKLYVILLIVLLASVASTAEDFTKTLGEYSEYLGRALTVYCDKSVDVEGIVGGVMVEETKDAVIIDIIYNPELGNVTIPKNKIKKIEFGFPVYHV